MKLQLKRSTLSIVRIFLGLATLTFAILSVLNKESQYLRLITQFCGFLLLLFLGLFTMFNQKRETLGYFLLGASILALASLILMCVVTL